MSPRLPALTSRQVLAALQRAGFFVHHQTGSHATLKHRDDTRLRVTIPVHARDLQRGTLMAIVRQSGMTVDELMRLL